MFDDVTDEETFDRVWPGPRVEAERIYHLMCEVVNRERSDWPTWYGELSHVEHMTTTTGEGE